MPCLDFIYEICIDGQLSILYECKDIQGNETFILVTFISLYGVKTIVQSRKSYDEWETDWKLFNLLNRMFLYDWNLSSTYYLQCYVRGTVVSKRRVLSQNFRRHLVFQFSALALQKWKHIFIYTFKILLEKAIIYFSLHFSHIIRILKSTSLWNVILKWIN